MTTMRCHYKNESIYNEQLISFLLIAVIAGKFSVVEEKEILKRQGPVSIRIFRNNPLSNWTKEPTKRLLRVQKRTHACILSLSLEERPVLSFTFFFFTSIVPRKGSKLSTLVNRMLEHIWPVETRELRVKYKL